MLCMSKYIKSKRQLKSELDTLAEIYKLEQKGELTQQEIASKVGISTPSIRNIKSRHARVWQQIEAMGVTKDDTKMAWLKSEEMSVLFYNPDFNTQNMYEMFDTTIDAIKQYAPKYRSISPVMPSGDHCLIMHPTDMHIGKDGSIGIEEIVLDKYKELLGMVRPFDISEVILTSGGDMLNVDHADLTTTKGTSVSCDGSSHAQMFDRALKFYITLIDSIASKHKVRFVNIMANHDYSSNLFLSKALEAWYHNHPNVEFQVNDDMRKYIQFGKNMFAFDHGYTVKEKDLAPTIAHEAYDMWGKTVYRYAFIGHIHTNRRLVYKTAQEGTGLQIEWLKAIARPDQWHRDKGFLNTSAIQSFVFNKELGEVARYTQIVV